MADFYKTFSGNSQYRHHARVTQGSVNVAGNSHVCSGWLWVEKLSGGGYFTSNSGNTGSMSGDVSFSANGWAPYDFTAYSSKLIGSGSDTVVHNSDGTKVASGSYAANDSSGGNFGSANGSWSLGLTRIYDVPDTPTGVTNTYVSDTQLSAAWSRPAVTNDAPNTSQIRKAVNGAAFVELAPISATTSVTVAVEANQKVILQVREANSAGTSAWSASSAAAYTTPAAPTDAIATKEASLDITVGFTPHVGYTEHAHEIWHGVVSGGVTTWDGAALVTLPSGTVSYTHVAPNAAEVHIYRVRATAGALLSGWSTSNSVQLLVAPNKPTTPATGLYSDKAADFVVNWVHNSVDTTPQKHYETRYSTDGGTTWNTTGKVTSTANSFTFAGGTYAADVALTTQVRTWGQAATGGSDGTGASPWSDAKTTTFKTIPVATITSPAEASVVTVATLKVNLGFSQAEGSTFVKATVRLLLAGVVQEELDSNILIGITMATKVQNDTAYTVSARVQGSNGLWSDWTTNAFSVSYLAPVEPVVDPLIFLPASGWGQIDLAIPEPGAGEAAAVTITVSREILDDTDILIEDYPTEALMTLLDTTPTVHGTNTYTITTTSAIGAETTVVVTLVTEECRRAYLSKGAGFDTVVMFGANLKVSESLGVASTTVEAAGRTKPIGLYGVETSVGLKVSSFIFDGFGQTISELRNFLLIPGRACYRDSSGRRVFGSVKGSVAYRKTDRGDLSFTLTETS